MTVKASPLSGALLAWASDALTQGERFSASSLSGAVSHRQKAAPPRGKSTRQSAVRRRHTGASLKKVVAAIRTHSQGSLHQGIAIAGQTKPDRGSTRFGGELTAAGSAV
jgi:hypothetical protein